GTTTTTSGQGTTGQVCSTNFGGELQEEQSEGTGPVHRNTGVAILSATALRKELETTFPEKELIMVKFTEVVRTAGLGNWKLIGKTMEPGRPAIDTIGFLDPAVDQQEA